MRVVWQIIYCSQNRQEVVRQEPSEESSLSAGLLDLTTAPATDPEEDMLAKQYVKKKKKPQRKRGFRLW